ncbi:JmjC domain-containing protein/JmjN domain-containing protein/zf-C5HC2 domain-containing protein, partial [Cephalotus follicularis]
KIKVDDFNLTDLEWTDRIPECPVYRPSEKKFADPLIYLQKIAPEASKYGICKIISPLKASISAADVLMKEKQGLNFHTYVQPLQLARWDMNDQATFYNGERKYTYNSFKRMADAVFAQRFPDSQSPSPEFVEKEFWHEMSHGKGKTVEYAVNIEGSAFSCDPSDRLGRSRWNLKTLPKLPKSTLHLLEYPIPGITDPMLYIGMLFSMFAWHVEDHYLYSINYHHTGAPKTWYGVPGHAALQFEKVTLDHVYCHNILSTDGEDGASEVLTRKTTMFAPNILLQSNVPVCKAVQNPGEFVITFPRAYHAGFNNGFGCGEAVNFAVGNWFPFGAAAGQRYALLRQMSILPYEELLCKEVIRYSKSKKLAEQLSDCLIQISFLRHIRSLNNALWPLTNAPALFTYMSNSQGTILCNLCKRDCYLAFVECSSCYKRACLFHGIKSLECSCLSKLIVYLREEIWKVEAEALKLEAKGILPNVEQEAK